MTAKERATVSLPADLMTAAKVASGGNLSAYIEQALRERRLRQAGTAITAWRVGAGAPRRGTLRPLRRGHRMTVQPQAPARAGCGGHRRRPGPGRCRSWSPAPRSKPCPQASSRRRSREPAGHRTPSSPCPWQNPCELTLPTAQHIRSGVFLEQVNEATTERVNTALRVVLELHD
ncbi:hypothetical protein [Streptomyces sp. KL2]|uniref:hypothetical protein n=1 Tax=Streptomyces sp. KL2 TaxID=3050126 RepID=UPI00397D1D86